MVGQVLSHYKILEAINPGAMGTVYREVATKLDHDVAPKVLPPELVAGREGKCGFVEGAGAGAERIGCPIPFLRSFYFLGEIHEDRGEMNEVCDCCEGFCPYWKNDDMDGGTVEEARQKCQKLEVTS